MSQVFNKMFKEVVLTRIFSSLVSDLVHISFYSHIIKVISNLKKKTIANARLKKKIRKYNLFFLIFSAFKSETSCK